MENEKRIGKEIRLASNLIKRHINNTACKKGLDKITGMHGWVVGYLCHHRDADVFQRDIEEEFQIRRSTVTATLQLMEKKGLITRESVAHDARLKRLVLTDKALELHEEFEREIERFEEKLQRDIGQEELEVFFRVMDKIKKAAM